MRRGRGARRCRGRPYEQAYGSRPTELPGRGLVEPGPQTVRAGGIRVEAVRIVGGPAADLRSVPEAGPGESLLPEEARHPLEERLPVGTQARVVLQQTHVLRRLRRREADDLPAAPSRQLQRPAEDLERTRVERGQIDAVLGRMRPRDVRVELVAKRPRAV